LTGGGPLGATRTLPVILYETAFRNFETYPALAIVVVVLVLNAVLTMSYFLLGRRFGIGDS
jgi:multiple sugar transport system permease protein